jgi:hypothetical protein
LAGRPTGPTARPFVGIFPGGRIRLKKPRGLCHNARSCAGDNT